MKCQDAQRLMLDGLEGMTDKEFVSALEDHLRRCPRCVRFRSDYEGIRRSLKGRALPKPPLDLVERTMVLCLAELDASESNQETGRIEIRAADPPRFIWAAFALLTALTLIFVVPRIEDINLNETLTFETALTFALLGQNAVMLFFAPVLIRRFGSVAGYQEPE